MQSYDTSMKITSEEAMFDKCQWVEFQLISQHRYHKVAGNDDNNKVTRQNWQTDAKRVT